ncbi:LPP20 family lipoprotein [Helicobacter brantae]|uniref:LPP20 lipofamily protein n=1 Tax=Helicobacter brantae TaxID=375927 RepID=A0A3D8J1X6_9HELI|nr:LPP20 family lipoprotein [Helicobacter brantae]RDU71206.1 hypothetical protein CQA58_03580 [Helicobacter brantae]
MKKIAVLSVFLALLGAEAPQWFLNPSVDSGKIYGLGKDSSIASAKKKAINDLVNSLQVSVKSTFDQTKIKQDKKINSLTSQTINLQSQIDDLTNIEPTKAQCDGENQCYVQVEISKADLINQLKRRIEQKKQELLSNTSPFEYQYRKGLFSKIQRDYVLYLSLGGSPMPIPEVEEKPTFDLVFEYDGDFSKSFKSVLEKTIQDYLTKFGKLSSSSQWKIVVEVLQEDKSVTLDISTKYGGEVLHNASVSDTQNPSVSKSFFAKRLGVQAYKKMQKWGRAD